MMDPIIYQIYHRAFIGIKPLSDYCIMSNSAGDPELETVFFAKYLGLTPVSIEEYLYKLSREDEDED